MVQKKIQITEADLQEMVVEALKNVIHKEGY